MRRIIGIDLSGPASPQNTAAVVCRGHGDHLEYEGLIQPADDETLYGTVAHMLKEGEVAVGLDAPLSYGATGGQRDSDRKLREKIMDLGLPPGSVMAPTAPRMVYLTLRGLGVARGLRHLDEDGRLGIVETHPGAALALGGAPVDAIGTYRDGIPARSTLLHWLESQGLRNLDEEALTATDHSVAGCAAAWATWRWTKEDSSWLYPAEPPQHPFDFAC